jgi:ornithine cyclodeaminase
MLILNDDDVRSLLSHSQAREVVRQAAVAYSAGNALVPVRTHMRLPQSQGEMLVMPGYVPEQKALGLKVVTEFTANKDLELPVTLAVLVLFDAATGVPIMLMNATYLTLVRTAAMSVVAAEYLAVSDPRRLTVIGAGAQAEAHVEAFLDRYDLTEVHVCSRTAARAQGLRDRVLSGHAGARVVVDTDTASAIQDADVIVVATSSRRPVVPAEHVAPGQFVCGIGSNSSDQAEIPSELVLRADSLVADTRAGGVDGAGDYASCIRNGDIRRDDVAELGEVIAGIRPGRTRENDLTIFKSVGFAALDLVAASFLYSEAVRLGAGSAVEI